MHFILKKFIKLTLAGTFVCALYQVPATCMESEICFLRFSGIEIESGALDQTKIPTDALTPMSLTLDKHALDKHAHYPPQITDDSTFIEQEVDAFIEKNKLLLSIHRYKNADDHMQRCRFLLTPEDAPTLHALIAHLWARYASHVEQTPPQIFLIPNGKLTTDDMVCYNGMFTLCTPLHRSIIIGEQCIHTLKKDVFLDVALVHEIGHNTTSETIQAIAKNITRKKRWYNKYLLRHLHRIDERLADILAIRHNPDMFIKAAERGRGFSCTNYEKTIGYVQSFVCPQYPREFDFLATDKHPLTHTRIGRILARKYRVDSDPHPSISDRIISALAYKYFTKRQTCK
jgi:hypothetical protein